MFQSGATRSGSKVRVNGTTLARILFHHMIAFQFVVVDAASVFDANECDMAPKQRRALMLIGLVLD